MDFLNIKFKASFVVCSIDIGSATSSISFLYVRQGDSFETLHEKVHRVKKWPGHKQENVDIPSALCYRNGRSIRLKMGVNAKPPGPGEDWVLVKNFKHHVLKLGSNSDLDSLPPSVSLAMVYQDWLKFLFDAGSDSFYDEVIPPEVWEQRICVFVAPNGWSESEMANVRKIIHSAGCVEYDGHVRFARESEATLHYWLYHGQSSELTKPELQFVVCNAGAATTDIGFYKVSSVNPLQYTEIAPAQSIEAGSSNTNDFNAVNLIEIRVRNMKKQIPANLKLLVMGGGYSNNEQALSQLKNNLKPDGIQVIGPKRGPKEFGLDESPTVDGGLYSSLHNFVSSRAAVWTYGTNILIAYNESTASEELKRRFQYAPYYHAGRKYVKHGWSTIVKKGEHIRDGEIRKQNYNQTFTEEPTENETVSSILYASEHLNPMWLYDEKGEKLMPGIREICRVSGSFHTNEVKLNKILWDQNKVAYKASFHFDIDFGSVTSKASLNWEGFDDKPSFASCIFHPPHGSERLWNLKRSAD